MASKYFKAFQFAKKVGPTIQGVAPKVAKTTGDKIKRTMGQIKRTMGARTKKLADDMEMKSKEIKDTLNKMRTPKLFGGRVKKKKPETKKDKSIKEKILPKKKKDRLEELRKELGMKKGGSALKPVDKQKNPGLAKLPTQVRNKMGYMKKGGSVKQAVKTITSPKTILRNIKSKRKFGGGKK